MTEIRKNILWVCFFELTISIYFHGSMVEVLEVLLMATVYSESRRTALAPWVNNSRWGAPVGARFLEETPPPRGGETGRWQVGECPLRSAGLGEFWVGLLEGHNSNGFPVFPRAEKLKTDAGSHAIGLQRWVVWSNGLRLFDALWGPGWVKVVSSCEFADFRTSLIIWAWDNDLLGRNC